MGGDRTGTLGGDVLLALLHRDADTTLAPLPPWQVRENALWDGLAHWMDAVQAACHLAPFSLLLPPNVELLLPGTAERRRLAAMGRKKGLTRLRRLFSGQDAPTGFFVLEERTYTPLANFDAHRTWVIEDTVDEGSGTVTRDEERWTVTGRPEVLLAEMRDNHDERVVGMYLRQACVLQRATAPSGQGVAAGEDGGGRTNPAAAAAERSGCEAQLSPLRLLRFIESAAPVSEGATTTAAVAAAAPGGVLEELALHAPLRHTHAGCRVSPLACDELVLGAAWPATCIVDYALLPPLREAMDVYCAKLHAARAAKGRSGTSRETVTCLDAIPSSAALATMNDDLRCELLRVLTDEKAMELREFYGDALLDYCVAVTTLSYRHASSNFAIWRGGNITESSTNNALVRRTLPRVLRDYWMARRRICNDKRLADCVESLFGAVTMALWVLPIRRRWAVGECEGVGSVQDAPAPDADMLLYVASALLQLLSSRSEG